MNSVKIQALPLIALLAVPALAQEQRWQVGLGANYNPSEKVFPAPLDANMSGYFKRADKIVPSIHAGYRFYDFAKSDLSVTGEFQPNAIFNVSAVVNEVQGRTVTSVQRSGELQSRFIAPGIQWNFHQGVDFGFGLQCRFTRLENMHSTVSTNDLRPWLLSYVGYTARAGEVMRPYVALRLAATPMTTRTPSYEEIAAGQVGRERLLKAMAGNVEISLQGGVRF